VFESLRLRTHMSQLVGALRALMGKMGQQPSAEVKREAIDILVRTLRGKDVRAREAALRQLRQLTGQDHGESADAWEAWWADHRKTFGDPSA
jgi:hypothetical protein